MKTPSASVYASAHGSEEGVREHIVSDAADADIRAMLSVRGTTMSVVNIRVRRRIYMSDEGRDEQRTLSTSGTERASDRETLGSRTGAPRLVAQSAPRSVMSDCARHATTPGRARAQRKERASWVCPVSRREWHGEHKGTMSSPDARDQCQLDI